MTATSLMANRVCVVPVHAGGWLDNVDQQKMGRMYVEL